MDYRTLGRTGLQVSVIGFGSLSISGMYGPVDDALSRQALHAAVDAGVNFLDTSDAYGVGHSERVIGAFLSERTDRGQVLLCTKGGNNMMTGVRNFTPDYIRGCLEGSLQRLGVEAIDVYLLHNPALGNMQSQDSYAVLETAKAQGKIKHWGVSVNTLEECDYVVTSGQPAVMQMEYNVLNQGAAAVFTRAHAAGVGVISRVPLLRGMLSGRFDEQTTFVEGDRRGGMFAPDKRPALVAKVRQMSDIVATDGLSPVEAAVRFCVSHPAVDVTIPGIRTPEQACANAAACTALPESLVAQLRQLA